MLRGDIMQVNLVNPYYTKNSVKTELNHEKAATASNTFSAVLQDNLQDNSAKSVKDSFVSSSRTNDVGEFNGTYPERLEQIHRLNEQTDWDSLNDVEKVKLFENRYDKAFGDFDVIRSNLYYCYSTRHEKVYDDYLQEREKYFGNGYGKAGITKLNKLYGECYREANYGSLSTDEIRADVQKKYGKSNSMESKYVMISEFTRNGAKKSGDDMIRSMISMQIFAEVENANKYMLYGTGMKISEHPRFLDMFMSAAKGIGDSKNYTPNWTQVIDIAKGMIHPAKGSDGDTHLKEIWKEMDDFLDEILKRNE